MFRNLILLVPFNIFASGNITIGLSTYTGSWATVTYQGSGTNLNLIDSFSSSSGPVSVFSYTFNTINYNNPAPTSNAIASTLFSEKKANYSNIYYSDNTLNNFAQIPLSNQTALSFTEQNGNSTQVVHLYMNQTSGLFSRQSNIVFPYIPLGYSQIQTGSVGNSGMFVSCLVGPDVKNNYSLLNQKGTPLRFSQSSLSPAASFANPSVVTQATNGTFATTAYVQNNYGISSIQYFKQSTTDSSFPKALSDYNQQSVNFITYDTTSNNLFFGDNTSYGTRLAASSFSTNGDFKNPNYLLAPYSYNSSQGLNINQDSSGLLYLTWNGNSSLYTAIFSPTASAWQTVTQGTSSLFGGSLSQTTALSNGLFFTQTQNSSNNYNLVSSVLSGTTFNFSTVTTINQSSAGTVTTFTNTPSFLTTLDGSGNPVVAYSGTAGTSNPSYQIFYNVFNNSKNTFTGQQTLTQGTPTSISAPVFINGTNQLAVVWSQNASGVYTIWASIFSGTGSSFGTPTQIFTGFTSAPQIIQAAGTFGFIFAGMN